MLCGITMYHLVFGSYKTSFKPLESNAKFGKRFLHMQLNWSKIFLNLVSLLNILVWRNLSLKFDFFGSPFIWDECIFYTYSDSTTHLCSSLQDLENALEDQKDISKILQNFLISSKTNPNFQDLVKMIEKWLAVSEERVAWLESNKAHLKNLIVETEIFNKNRYKGN